MSGAILMGIPGGIFYNTGSQHQQLGQQVFTNTLYDPFGIPLGQQRDYCQNCDCPGCRIHRERLRLQQEEALQREKITEQALYHMAGRNLFTEPGDVDAMTGKKLKPESVIPLDVKPGIVTKEWWAKHRWKFYLFWSLGVAGIVHLFMTCATRQV